MDLTGISFVSSDIGAVAALVLTGLAAVWTAKKLLGLAR